MNKRKKKKEASSSLKRDGCIFRLGSDLINSKTKIGGELLGTKLSTKGPKVLGGREHNDVKALIV